jgi:hypothetical protein
VHWLPWAWLGTHPPTQIRCAPFGGVLCVVGTAPSVSSEEWGGSEEEVRSEGVTGERRGRRLGWNSGWHCIEGHTKPLGRRLHLPDPADTGSRYLYSSLHAWYVARVTCTWTFGTLAQCGVPFNPFNPFTAKPQATKLRGVLQAFCRPPLPLFQCRILRCLP